MSYSLGIDVGGTFTDLLVSDVAGISRIFKAPTTPADPSDGVFAALHQAAGAYDLELSAFLARVAAIVHGTTITTNAVLTGRGARTGLLTTRGFRDLLGMRRGMKGGQRYDLQLAPPEPLIERALVLPIAERVDAAGEVVIPLAEDDVREAAALLRAAGVDAVAVSYLWSFLNPTHERRTREILADALPGVYVSLSSEVLPQIRAYERHSTTALNAYSGPPLAVYLRSLRRRLGEHGFAGVLNIMQSNGGCMSPEVTGRFAVNTLLSGPAGGPGAGIHYGSMHGRKELITVDMGGTSFDVALVQGGKAIVTSENEVGGYHVGVPMLDIHTVGAGGGSIAWVDPGGMLHVGPQSAGADPGPACYGRGGTDATVTDADLVLGYLDENYFHGGALRLDREAAIAAIQRAVAGPLGLSVAEAAHGIHRVANSIMSGAVSVVTVQRGLDPREFTMIVAGGAGPIHAAAIAAELGIGKLLVPRESSVFCAAGMLLSDLKHSYVRTCAMAGASLDVQRMSAQLRDMQRLALDTFAREGIDEGRVELAFSADLRYVGQFNEVEVPGLASAEVDEHVWKTLLAEFHRRHDERYGYAMPGAEVELINLRLTATGATPKPRFERAALADADASHALKGRRAAWFDGAMREAPVYDGLALQPGNELDGPAIIEQPTTTIILPQGARLSCDAWGHYLLQLAEAARHDSGADAGIDPVDVAVISSRLESICREMGETMLRTSRSPIFSEARDFTTALFDDQPELVAQTIYIPDIAASTPFTAEAIAKRFAGDVHEGDLFVLNDPYRGNNHPPDLNVMKPVFWDGRLRFWLLSKGHHADMGGGGVVGYNPGAHDAWEDALRIPCLRLADRGRLREDLLDFILLNVRARELVEGDIHCQIGAVNLGERRLLALLERYGPQTLQRATREILQATERRVRVNLSAIPDGEYRAERAIDHDGIELERSPVVRLCVRVQGDTITFDYTGTDPQSVGYLNSTPPNTTAMSQLALFATHAISDDIQFNAGAVRPLSIVAPPGTLVNANEPAPTSACTLCVGEAMIEATWLALAQVIPDQVSALWGRWCAPATAGINPRSGRFFADIHFMSKGGGGAVKGFDGWDHVGTPVTLGGLRAPDPELHELVTPYHLLEYQLQPDSAGAGRWRGGFGVSYRFEVQGDDIACANFGSGARDFTAPLGLHGGLAAAPHRMSLRHADGRTTPVDGNQFYTLRRGDRFTIVSSGGGGFGDPRQRSPDAVLRDVRNGLVSRAQAREVYGVAVSEGRTPLEATVDEAATARLRADTARA